MTQQNHMYFDQSIAGMLVGRSQHGKNYQVSTAFEAVGDLGRGTLEPILRPVLYLDAEGSLTQGRMTGAPDDVVRRLPINDPPSLWDGMNHARSGAYRLVILDGWTRTFEKLAAYYQRTQPSAKNRNQDWNRMARDDLALLIEQWFDLAVQPATRGVVLLSTALLTDQWAGEFQGGNRQIIGERIAVSETIGPRLMSHNHFIWQCTRVDPAPIAAVDAQGRQQLDIDATNAAMMAGQLRSKFITYTRPLAGVPWVKYQDGFASEYPPIAVDLNLGHVLSRHHQLYGRRPYAQQQAAVA